MSATTAIGGSIQTVSRTKPAAAIAKSSGLTTALITTKLPILLGHELGPFNLPDFKRYGFWSAQHESRADLTMLLGCLYLLIVGSGRWSIDRLLDRDAVPPA
ncbi:hypothetical protein [Sphingomonas sp. UV9]|uniref:hypothetical protein n=1 Tax=Sphingomonas sp. UV9 TaxID=1851410 RepID=UPI0013E898EA|nr:hypothetical protein [Sphingomonas sp. UV9]